MLFIVAQTRIKSRSIQSILHMLTGTDRVSKCWVGVLARNGFQQGQLMKKKKKSALWVNYHFASPSLHIDIYIFIHTTLTVTLLLQKGRQLGASKSIDDTKNPTTKKK
jgi:hypothetical protein